MRKRIELFQGTLGMLILQTLRRESRHGYDIAQAIGSGSGEVWQAETGSLYPARRVLPAHRSRQEAAYPRV